MFPKNLQSKLSILHFNYLPFRFSLELHTLNTFEGYNCMKCSLGSLQPPVRQGSKSRRTTVDLPTLRLSTWPPPVRSTGPLTTSHYHVSILALVVNHGLVINWRKEGLSIDRVFWQSTLYRNALRGCCSPCSIWLTDSCSVTLCFKSRQTQVGCLTAECGAVWWYLPIWNILRWTTFYWVTR